MCLLHGLGGLRLHEVASALIRIGSIVDDKARSCWRVADDSPIQQVIMHVDVADKRANSERHFSAAEMVHLASDFQRLQPQLPRRLDFFGSVLQFALELPRLSNEPLHGVLNGRDLMSLGDELGVPCNLGASIHLLPVLFVELGRHADVFVRLEALPSDFGVFFPEFHVHGEAQQELLADAVPVREQIVIEQLVSAVVWFNHGDGGHAAQTLVRPGHARDVAFDDLQTVLHLVYRTRTLASLKVVDQTEVRTNDLAVLQHMLRSSCDGSRDAAAFDNRAAAGALFDRRKDQLQRSPFHPRRLAASSLACLTVRDASETADRVAGLRKVLDQHFSVLDLPAKLQNALLSLLVSRREENTVPQMAVQDAPSHGPGDNGRFTGASGHCDRELAAVQHDVLQSFDQFLMILGKTEPERSRMVREQMELQVLFRPGTSFRVDDGRNGSDFAACS